MLVLTRIDDRLIHGQVVEGWVNYLKATCIIVADDRVALNAFQRSVMEISVPRGLKVFIGSVVDMCGKIRAGALDGERVILLFSNPGDVRRALEQGLPTRTVNIGGMRYVQGKRKLMDVLAVNDADIRALNEIAAMGVSVDIQTVPTGKPLALGKVFNSGAASGDR